MSGAGPMADHVRAVSSYQVSSYSSDGPRDNRFPEPGRGYPRSTLTRREPNHPDDFRRSPPPAGRQVLIPFRVLYRRPPTNMPYAEQLSGNWSRTVQSTHPGRNRGNYRSKPRSKNDIFIGRNPPGVCVSMRRRWAGVNQRFYREGALRTVPETRSRSDTCADVARTHLRQRPLYEPRTHRLYSRTT
ncbi:hypothetical protein Bbelb_274660 [Branchiostoma belcheri]|nr:hypothetical protein Bbelb_274660 [Branchiostoma belcheri]